MRKGLGRHNRRSAFGFSPGSLFVNGEQGAWYDPSDININWRRNLLTYTQQFDNAVWIKSNYTVSAVAGNVTTAPDGTATAYNVIPSATNTAKQLYYNFGSATAAAYTFSVYAKNAGQRWLFVSNYAIGGYLGTWFDLQNGVVGTKSSNTVATIESVGNGWYRCAVTNTVPGSPNYMSVCPASADNVNPIYVAFTGDGTSGIYIWGAQLEQASTASAYQQIVTPEITYLATVQSQPVLFQDAAGTTPVTAVEQAVRLMLDKSKGLALGSELIANPDFTTDTWWSKDAGVTISGGTANWAATAATFQIYRTLILTVGRYYEITFTITSISAGGLRVMAGSGTAGTTRTAAGTYTERLLCAGSGTVAVQSVGASTTASVDNVSYKEVQGNHATAPSDTARPILRARYNLLTYSEQFDNAAWSKVALNTTGTPAWVNVAVAPDGTTTAEKLIATAVNTGHYTAQPATVSAVSYTYTCYAKAGEYNYCVLNMYGAAVTVADKYAVFNLTNGNTEQVAAGVTGSATSVGNGWYRLSATFTMVAAGSLSCYVYASNAATFAGSTFIGDGTSGIYIWGAQLLTAADQTATGGAYQRIAAATDYATISTTTGYAFLPYLAFDGVDDSMSTGSVDFTATDKMTVWGGLTKLSDAAGAKFIELSAAYVSNNGSFVITAPEGSGQYGVAINNSGNDYYLPSTYTAPITNVISAALNFAGAARAQKVIPRINGVLNQNNAGGTGGSSGNFGNYPLYIGARNNAGEWFNGRIYSLIIRGAQSTAAQISATEYWVGQRTGVQL